MVNYRRILWEVTAVCAILALAAAAPATDYSDSHYDQRQNGSENVRIHIDGFFVAVVPADTLADTLLAAVPNISDLLDIDDLENFQKPKPPASLSPPKPISPPKPEEKPQETAKPISLPPKPEEKPEEIPQNPQSEVDKPQLEADKLTVIESLSTRSTESPISDVSLNSEPVKGKKPLTNEQKKALRLKKIFGSLLAPLVRLNRHH